MSDNKLLNDFVHWMIVEKGYTVDDIFTDLPTEEVFNCLHEFLGFSIKSDQS